MGSRWADQATPKHGIWGDGKGFQVVCGPEVGSGRIGVSILGWPLVSWTTEHATGGGQQAARRGLLTLPRACDFPFR